VITGIQQSIKQLTKKKEELIKKKKKMENDIRSVEKMLADLPNFHAATVPMELGIEGWWLHKIS
jgi:septal ring factor EnvC (AmiA/AmiB activator)